MGPTPLLVRAEWRRGIGSLALLALLIALGGGLVMATAAGARRADTAFDRFLGATGSGNVEVSVIESGDPARTAEMISLAPELAALPGVRTVRSLTFVAVSPEIPGRTIAPFAGLIRHLGGEPRPEYLVVDGRAADPAAPGEIVINETAAQQANLEPGDEVALIALGPDQFATWVGENNDAPSGPTPVVRVVGVARTPEDVSDGPEPITLLTPAFLDAHRDEILSCDCVLTLYADPARVAEVKQAVASVVEPRGFTVRETDDTLSRRVDDAVALETNALRLAAIVGAITTLLVVVQVLARHISGAAHSLEALPALGASRAQQVLPWSIVLAPFAILGALGAALLAIAVSPHLPRGLAATAEPKPGVRIDMPVLVVGGLAVVAVVLAAGLTVALVGGRRRRVVPHTHVAGRWFPSLSPQGQLGVSMATGTGARGGGVGALMTVAAGAVAIAGVISVALLHRSIDHAVTTPASFGADWDLQLVSQPEDPDATIAAVLKDPGVEAVGLLYSSTLDGALARSATNSIDIDPTAIDSLEGFVGPLLSRGRMPATGEEVVVGPDLAAVLGVDVGDELSVWRGQDVAEVRYVVSGIGRLPDDDENDRVFFTTMPGLERAMVDGSETVVRGGLVRLADDAGAATARNLAGLGFVSAVAPSNIDNLRELGEVPTLVAAAMVFLGIAGLAHALILGMRRGRRELAIAAALGCTRRQLARTSSWQAAALAGAVIVIGVPVGIVVGRALWSRMAAGVSATPFVEMPWLVLTLSVVVTVAVAWLIAPGIGRRSTRMNSARVLRGE